MNLHDRVVIPLGSPYQISELLVDRMIRPDPTDADPVFVCIHPRISRTTVGCLRLEDIRPTHGSRPFFSNADFFVMPTDICLLNTGFIMYGRYMHTTTQLQNLGFIHRLCHRSCTSSASSRTASHLVSCCWIMSGVQQRIRALMMPKRGNDMRDPQVVRVDE